jgi:RimJ/RimL family protein N-acetyltransferase
VGVAAILAMNAGDTDHPAPAAGSVVTATERLVLRWLDEGDASFILELMNDPDWLRFIGDRGVRTLEDARAYLAEGPVAMYARLGFGMYAVELATDPRPIGICGLVKRDWLEEVDLGFAFLPRFRGAGYAYEAAAATMVHARSVGLERLLAIVSPDNHASQRLLSRLGFHFDRRASPGAGGDEVCIFSSTLA